MQRQVQPAAAQSIAANIAIMRGLLTNLFENLPLQTKDEEFTELLSRPGVRIERIVSNGQSTPVDTPFNQDHDEWVLLSRGSASLWVDGDGECDLYPGDYMLIPSRRTHLVTRTAKDEPTIWLAVPFWLMP
jgi:cupin 2 domain-containing protein